ncbi:MAG: cardiolipin synthase [Gammaproteobacteria bacterium]|nr:cardiolipin synthase [Gammaproteobacteria bacterium]
MNAKKTARKGLRKTKMIVILVVVFEILGIMSAVHAVMSARTPQGSIAWAVSLVTFPYVSVPAYWVLGRNKFHGYVLARRKEIDGLAQVFRETNTLLDSALIDESERRGAIKAAETLARSPLTDGNRADLLIDGQATFDSIFQGIDAAEKYVLVQFYIVRDDDLGQQLQDKLIEAASRGVRVLFLFDEIGSVGLSAAYRRRFEDAGIALRPFHSRKGSGNRFQLNFRNHRKTVVVDGKVAWIGGHNVGDEYLGKDVAIGNWRDTHVRLQGPVAISAQLAFVEDWRWATDSMPDDLTWTPTRAPEDDMLAIVMPTGPADEMETASLIFTGVINAAQRRVWIASPYFVPDDAVVQALQLAGLRGVDVRILIPEKADSMLVTLAAYAFFDQIKAAGVKFYRYNDGFLHQKVVLVDDSFATVGTANFDNRSFRLNFEITAAIANPDFAAEVSSMLEADFAKARLMKIGEYDKKPFWFKLAVRTARLTAPVL